MNRRLLILNGIAIIDVVANHASHVGVIAMFWWTNLYRNVTVPNFDQMGSLSYYGLVAEQKLALFSVPSFLFVSGVFIAYAMRGRQSRLSWGMIKKRILNLLPPYLIWTLVFVVLEITVTGATYTLREFLLSFITVRFSPFFFVPLLIVYFLISPLLAPLAKNHWQWLLAGALALQITATLRAYLRLSGSQGDWGVVLNLVFPSQIAEYFFFYTAGIIAGLRLTPLKRTVYKFRWGLLALTGVFALFAVAEAEWIFRQYNNPNWRSATLSVPTFLYAILFILSYLAFDHVKLPFSKTLYQIGVGTLGIYLMHKSVLLIVPKIIYHILPFALGYQILYQPLLICIAIGVPLLLMNLIKRFSLKKRYRTFFG
jgi:fucose 4-O-acetylase-like acetyltransferase